MSDTIRTKLERHLPDLVALRRDIHTHPELGMEETRTAALVAEKLRGWGIETAVGVGNTGVVGTLRGRRPGQGAIGLRADMDALALTEHTGLPYASAHAGRMHACGHDGHTTMLLGAAQLLAEDPDFAGTVHFIFQPAEEGRGGAMAMLDDKLFERFPCDAVYGMHNMPGVPVGQFELRPGPFMAGAGRWTAKFHGTGGHGGNSPHLATDVTLAQAVFIQALQGIVSRNVSAMEAVVVSVGHIEGGSPDALNVIPADLVVGGTMRCFTPEMKALLERRIPELAQLAAATQNTTVEVDLFWNTVPLVNHPAETETAAAAARGVVGDGNVSTEASRVGGGEDFAYMLEKKPGSLIFLGNGVGPDGTAHALHTPLYDFNDEALPHGVAYWVKLVQQELATGA